jgi:hypothetical protein
MFASMTAKAPATAAASPARKTAQPGLPPPVRRLASAHARAPRLQWSIGNQAPCVSSPPRAGEASGHAPAQEAEPTVTPNRPPGPWWDFGKLPLSPAEPASGSEASAPPPNPLAIHVGGDTDSPQTSPDPTIANQPGPTGAVGLGAPAGAGGASLSFKTGEKKDLGCGGYRWNGLWQLSGATQQTNGFVVQKVLYSFDDHQCGSGEQGIKQVGTYWEAWQVQGGSVFGCAGLPGGDTFQTTPHDGYYGLYSQEGHAKYMDGYTEPSKWGTLPEAGCAPATRSQPPGWSDAGAVDRSARDEFNCCAKDQPPPVFTTSDDGT